MLRETRLMMGMPITVQMDDANATRDDLDQVFAYFQYVDETFSTYRSASEVSRLNCGELAPEDFSPDLRAILMLAETTKRETGGYFDIMRGSICDPSGIVKGWAIQQAAELLRARGRANYYVDAGGDIAVAGLHAGAPWRVGIRNPFNRQQIVKALAVTDCGVATSGTAIRGQHIYNPFEPATPLLDIVSLTIVGPNVRDADRFATGAFAMGRAGIRFIEDLPGFEGYMIDAQGIATYTSGFQRFVLRA
ncbi:MAG TPA: FAD:protein FMN transferase [Ktedonobacterales bacterium]|jgi:thiamine biosynthesis lipoprotein|nr:FAD:protein FMN transferase [Ktedonobacterales bacterium]